MAQLGVHMLVGLAVGDQLLKRMPAKSVSRRVALGVLLGSALPDLDAIAGFAAFPLDVSLALGLHRSFSHSLTAVALVLGVFLALSLLVGHRQLGHYGVGLALGVALHIALDLFLWFSPVDVFWPASAFGLAEPVNLWQSWRTPDMLGRLLGAGEYAALGFYFFALASRARAGDEAGVRWAAIAARLACQCFSAFFVVVAAAVVLPGDLYAALVFIPLGLIGLPACLYLTVAMYPSIAAVPRTSAFAAGRLHTAEALLLGRALLVETPRPRPGGQ